MEYKTLILADTSAAALERIDDLRELCRVYAGYFNEAVGLAVLETKDLERLNKDALYAVKDGIEYVKPLPPQPEPPAVTEAFVYREDGRADWPTMNAAGGELALYGGTPVRSNDNPLDVPEPEAEGTPPVVNETVLELKRGIWETTGLFAEPAQDGWMSITCNSRKMAAWMCAAIIIENIEARCDEERLYVPATAAFEVQAELRDVIAAVAKVHQYWAASIGG